MRIPRSILLAWVTAALFSPNILFAQDEDTEAQAKARQALGQKMKELQQPPATAPTTQPAVPTVPVPTVPPPETPAVQPTPVVTPVPLPATVTPVPPAQPEPGATDKLSDAVRQKMMELEEQKKMAPVVAPQPDRTQPVQTAEPKRVQPKVEPPPSQPVFAELPGAPAGSNSWDAAINAAVEQARAEADAARKAEQAQQAEPAGHAPTAANSRPARITARKAEPNRTTVLPAMQGPPSGLSASQEQRLQDLNRRYFADRISSEEYHEQRARIMAQP